MSHTAQELLDLATPRAARSVRIARQYLGQASRLDGQAARWRRISTTLAVIAPILLLVVIAGSLIETNSALVETLWEFTAGAMLLAGVGIAMADSRSFFLRSFDTESNAPQIEEARQIAATSALASAWREVLAQEQRALCQFDVEIMWALAAHEQSEQQGKDQDPHH